MSQLPYIDKNLLHVSIIHTTTKIDIKGCYLLFMNTNSSKHVGKSITKLKQNQQNNFSLEVEAVPTLNTTDDTLLHYLHSKLLNALKARRQIQPTNKASLKCDADAEPAYYKHFV